MHDFTVKGKYLYCEDISVESLAKKYGTPLYVYSYHTLIDHFIKLKTAFKEVDPLICYSVKANSNLSILKALVEQGAGLDIVSGGELYRALRAGCLPEKIVYASVGKTSEEIEDAVRKNILFFNVESIPELESINRIARKRNKTVQVAIRINPDVEPGTHRFITTGKLTNKFGIDFKSAYTIFSLRGKFRHLLISGIHIHIGSQITRSKPYVAALKKVIDFVHLLREKKIGLEYLNIGGGLGIIYDDEKPQTAERFAREMLPWLRLAGLKVIMEPGRFIVGNAGILVTKVLYLKSTPLKKFVIVDAGMNDLIRPALYEAYHVVMPVKVSKASKRKEKVDVVGPICESGDYFAKARELSPIKESDCLAVMSAGAYGYSMSSNYNSRRRAAEVMVKNGKAYVIRKRESFDDLVRNEIII